MNKYILIKQLPVPRNEGFANKYSVGSVFEEQKATADDKQDWPIAVLFLKVNYGEWDKYGRGYPITEDELSCFKKIP